MQLLLPLVSCIIVSTIHLDMVKTGVCGCSVLLGGFETQTRAVHNTGVSSSVTNGDR